MDIFKVLQCSVMVHSDCTSRGREERKSFGKGERGVWEEGDGSVGEERGEREENTRDRSYSETYPVLAETTRRCRIG